MNALFVGLSLVAAAPALKGPVRGEPPPIVGYWVMTDWEIGGQPTTFTQGTSIELTPDGKRIWQQGPGTVAEERGYKLIPRSSPAAVDLIRPSPGQAPDVFPCIYKLDGDKLIISVGHQEGARPKDFNGTNSEVWMIMTYKRTKKE